MSTIKTVTRKDFLNLLAESKNPKRRRLLVEWAGKNDLDAISEISLNTLRGNVKLSPSTYKKIQKYKKALRTLALKKASIKKRKQIIKQQGGFLPFLIPAALLVVSSIVPEIVKSIAKKKNKKK